MTDGLRGMTLDVAEVLAVGNAPDQSAVGSAGAVQKQSDGEYNTAGDTGFDTFHQGEQNGDRHGRKVAARVAPGLADHAKVNQREARHRDGGGQGGDR